MLASLSLVLKKRKKPHTFCKNLSKPTYFQVFSSKLGFTRPLTGLLLQIFGFCNQLIKPNHCFPPWLCFLLSPIFPRTGLRILYSVSELWNSCNLLPREGKDLLLHGLCVALPILSALVTEQMLQLRGHHLLSQISLQKETPAAKSLQPQHVHQGNFL